MIVYLDGPIRVVPSAFFCAIVLATGQKVYNMVEGSSRKSETLEFEGKKGWLDSKWSPVSVLKDENYENILEEKVLRVNAEIEMIDEDIRNLQSQRDKQKGQGVADEVSKSP